MVSISRNTIGAIAVQLKLEHWLVVFVSGLTSSLVLELVDLLSLLEKLELNIEQLLFE